MIKMVLMALGAIAFLFGAVDWLVSSVDWLVGALILHSWILVLTSVIALVAAWIVHMWEKAWQNLVLPSTALAIAIFCAVDTCAAGPHEVLIPPEKTPVVPWNPNAMTGAEVWGIIVILVMVGLVVYMARSSIKRSIGELARLLKT